MKKHFLSILAACFISVPALAQAPAEFKVGTGIKDLAYASQFNETKTACSNSVPGIAPNPTTGAIQNVELLAANKINAGYTQVDVLHLMQKARDLSNLKVLYVLGKEQVVFIGKASPRKVGGYGVGKMVVGGTDVHITEITQLKGMRLAAGGGAVATAKQIRLESEINYEIVEVSNSAEAVTLLKQGKVDAAIVVTAEGSGLLEELPAAYRVLAIPEATRKKIEGVYPASTVTYKNIAPNGVVSVSVQGVFVTRNYVTPERRQQLMSLRDCVIKNLDVIKETTGTHAAWQGMNRQDQTPAAAKWPMYDGK